MTRYRVSDPIAYLIAKRFPNYRSLQPSNETQHLVRQIKDYRITLEAKKPEELHMLVEQEQAKDLEILQRHKAECEERERFSISRTQTLILTTGAKLFIGPSMKRYLSLSAKRPR